MEDIIEQYYEEYNYPSIVKLMTLLKKDGHNDIKKKDVENFLNKKVELQVLKETKKSKKKLGHIISFKPYSIAQMDIYYMQKYYKENHNYKYILCLIDVFTRQAFCEGMKSKDIEDVTNSFIKILAKMKEYPYLITSDNDSTFLSNEFQKILNKHEIVLKTVAINDHHSLGIVDRFARTLKTILHKRFVKYHSTNWIDHLDSIIKKYNNSPHSSIDDIKPIDADNKFNIPIIFEINEIKKLEQNDSTYDKSKFQIDDKVRIELQGFQKKSEGKYSNEIYKVKEINGKTITLDNGKKYKYDQLLKIHKDTIVQPKTNIIKHAKKEYKNELLHKKIDIQPENIVHDKRVKKAKQIYDV